MKTTANDELERKLKEGKNIKLIDVREPFEYSFQRIPQAINIPLGQLQESLDQLNKDDEIYLICQTGNRSGVAGHHLVNLGYKNIHNVLPGMIGWSGDTEQSSKTI